jgi:hypothetical protein
MDNYLMGMQVVAFMSATVIDLNLEEMEDRTALSDAATIPSEILRELIRLARLGQLLERTETTH